MAKVNVKKTVKKTKKKNAAEVTEHGRVYITSTFNNTLITVTNDRGDALGWSSSGSKGFKGTRKSTPYAAGMAVEDVVRQIVSRGLKSADVFIKGPGSGRDSSLRAVKTSGVSIVSISDITPMPHNGPRPKKRRRV